MRPIGEADRCRCRCRRIAADRFHVGVAVSPGQEVKNPLSPGGHNDSLFQFHAFPHRLSIDFRPDICPCGGVVPLGPHLDLRCTAPSIHSSLLWDSLCHLSPRHPPACPWGFAGRYRSGNPVLRCPCRRCNSLRLLQGLLLLVPACLFVHSFPPRSLCIASPVVPDLRTIVDVLTTCFGLKHSLTRADAYASGHV